jgi:hypothetical protein
MNAVQVLYDDFYVLCNAVMVLWAVVMVLCGAVQMDGDKCAYTWVTTPSRPLASAWKPL